MWDDFLVNRLQPEVSALTAFTMYAKPSLVRRCQACHGIAQGSIAAFLTPGMEYTAITGYQLGKFVNVPEPTQSLLLSWGVHTGPALGPDEYTAVERWLTIESALRASRLPGREEPALLPTVPVIDGDFRMSFGTDPVINDPQAYISFRLTPDSGNFYRVSNLKLTAGPRYGIRIKNPKFYFLTNTRLFSDPADSLSIVDLSVPANESRSIGFGTVLLTNVPTDDPSIRIGLGLQHRQRLGPPPEAVYCKNFKDFDPALLRDLQGCANQCHAGPDASATAAFDMKASQSTDLSQLQGFCIQALGRINKAMPSKSLLLLEVLLPEMGGTANHPFKYDMAADIARFTDEVTAWAAGEK